MDSIVKTVLVSFVFILVWQSVSSLNACPKCGNIEVPYPFSTDDGCGNPSYKVSCSVDGVLEFASAKGFRYKILSIDPTGRRLTISPPRMQAGTCSSSDFPLEGLRLDEGSPFNISARNTVMLLNCSTALLRSPLNCSATSLCRQFEEKMEEGSACRGTLCCHYLKDTSMNSHFIRVRPGGCTAYTSVVNINAADPDNSESYLEFDLCHVPLVERYTSHQ